MIGLGYALGYEDKTIANPRWLRLLALSHMPTMEARSRLLPRPSNPEWPEEPMPPLPLYWQHKDTEFCAAQGGQQGKRKTKTCTRSRKNARIRKGSPPTNWPESAMQANCTSGLAGRCDEEASALFSLSRNQENYSPPSRLPEAVRCRMALLFMSCRCRARRIESWVWALTFEVLEGLT